MRGFIIGFVAGAAVTGAVILAPWGDSGVSVDPEFVSPASPTQVRTSIDLPMVTEPDILRVESEQSERSQRTPAAAGSHNPAVEHEDQNRRRSNLSPEQREAFYASLEQDALNSEKVMEAEAVDVEWAQRVQTEFWNYLSRKPDLHEFGSLQVDCRSTWCEVKFLSYGESAADIERVVRLVADGADEFAWSNEWTLHGVKTDQEHGSAAVSMFVQKVEPDHAYGSPFSWPVP